MLSLPENQQATATQKDYREALQVLSVSIRAGGAGGGGGGKAGGMGVREKGEEEKDKRVLE